MAGYKGYTGKDYKRKDGADERGYTEKDYTTGWHDQYLYPGEHHGQISSRAAKANHRLYQMRYRKDDYGGKSPGVAPVAQRNLGYPTRKRQMEQGQTSLGNPKGLRDLEKTSGTVSKKAKDKLNQKDANSNAKKVLQDAFNKKKKGK